MRWTEDGSNADTVTHRVRLIVDGTPRASDEEANAAGAHTFNGLVPGQKYKASVVAVAADGSESSKKETNDIYTGESTQHNKCC